MKMHKRYLQLSVLSGVLLYILFRPNFVFAAPMFGAVMYISLQDGSKLIERWLRRVYTHPA